MLGLHGLRIFEACSANITDLGEEHGHRVLKVRGKGDKTVLIPLPPAAARAIERAIDGRQQGPILRNLRGRRMDRHAATRRLQQLSAKPGSGRPGCTRTCCATPSSPPCSTPESASATCRSPPGTPTRRPQMRYDRARKNLDRHPNYILAAHMASGT
jgi:integrase/recombinase XerD